MNSSHTSGPSGGFEIDWAHDNGGEARENDLIIFMNERNRLVGILRCHKQDKTHIW